MARRVSREKGFDIMAFQDVITSTTGIMLLFTLVLILSIGVNKFIEAGKAQEDLKEQLAQDRANARVIESVLSERQSLLNQIEEKERILAQYMQAEISYLEQIKTAKVEPKEETPKGIPVQVIKPVGVSTPLYLHASGDEVRLLSKQSTAVEHIDDFMTSLGYTDSPNGLVPSTVFSSYDGVVLLLEPSAYKHTLEYEILLSIEQLKQQVPFTYVLVPEDSILENL